MRFRIVEQMPPASDRPRDTVLLLRGNWDDWFQFSTLYTAVYFDEKQVLHQIGDTKLGEFGLVGARSDSEARPGVRYPTPPRKFTALGDDHFSLGQDTSYYEALTKLGDSFREEFLASMRDLALDPELLTRAKDEPVTGVSLLRDVPLTTVSGQYARLARGGARLTSFKFKLTVPSAGEDLTLKFAVKPHSTPPTNIHVLIGRNGVGKSTVLNRFAREIVESSRTSDDATDAWNNLTNVVTVSFSAFDSFEPISVPRDRTRGVTAYYVGLKKIGAKNEDDDAPLSETKDLTALSREMTAATRTCLLGARRPRLMRALELLEGDPIFAGIGIRNLLADDDHAAALKTLPLVFKKLSSGHKIVLLTIAKLVETVEEKSLVLLDEPEAHLHPPLLSAFVRALSELLTNRNGMAVVATHSPVVLQEVPRSCVWKLQRSGSVLSADRPRRETFGENVGTLTDEVFGLEVTATGFHRMLFDAAQEHRDYSSALDCFEGQLGSEGRAILRSMISLLSEDSDVES